MQIITFALKHSVIVLWEFLQKNVKNILFGACSNVREPRFTSLNNLRHNTCAIRDQTKPHTLLLLIYIILLYTEAKALNRYETKLKSNLMSPNFSTKKCKTVVWIWLSDDPVTAGMGKNWFWIRILQECKYLPFAMPPSDCLSLKKKTNTVGFKPIDFMGDSPTCFKNESPAPIYNYSRNCFIVLFIV